MLGLHTHGCVQSAIVLGSGDIVRVTLASEGGSTSSRNERQLVRESFTCLMRRGMYFLEGRSNSRHNVCLVELHDYKDVTTLV